MNNAVSKPVVAAFDFDGTITYHDSLLPFLMQIDGPWKCFGKLLLELPALLGFALGKKSRQQVKERILRRFFKGKSLEEIQKEGRKYAFGSLNRHIRPKALERLQWHLAQGHRCILISASLDVYLKPWAEKVGINEILTSRFEVDSSGVVTGRLLGANCWGPEKVRRLMELIGPKEGYVLYAYGDSRGDQELLAMADYPFFRCL